MRKPEDRHDCPLLNRSVFWGGPGGCYEIQEVRDDNMDMELLPMPIDLKKAEEMCEKCLWYKVNRN